MYFNCLSHMTLNKQGNHDKDQVECLFYWKEGTNTFLPQHGSSY